MRYYHIKLNGKDAAISRASLYMLVAKGYRIYKHNKFLYVEER